MKTVLGRKSHCIRQVDHKVALIMGKTGLALPQTVPIIKSSIGGFFYMKC